MRGIVLAATVLLGACVRPPATQTASKIATVVDSDEPKVLLDNGLPLRLEGVQAGDQVDLASLEYNPTDPFVPKARPLPAKGAAEQGPGLSEGESARCRQAAWEAVNSAAMLQRFKPKRISDDPSQPFQFRREGITCYFRPENPDIVAVAVPSGGISGYHACYLEVTLDRTTCEVLGMQESFWP